MKTRTFPESNYKAIFIDGKTIRFALDPNKPITELQYPEFYDIKITDQCDGECPYCYQDSKVNGDQYTNLVNKTDVFFERMSSNELPFQVALGGGEPTNHPQLLPLCDLLVNKYDIQTSYTTNGMNLDNPDLPKIMELCAGVAVSTHPHLQRHWVNAIDFYARFNKCLNLHVIISDSKSVDDFVTIYNLFQDKISFFVMLPMTAIGRCSFNEPLAWDYFVEKTRDFNRSKIAFGARFYPYLKRRGHGFAVSMYEPEIMSKFLDLRDMKLYGSSFDIEK